MVQVLRTALMIVLALMVSGLGQGLCACAHAAPMPTTLSHHTMSEPTLDVAMDCHEDEGASAPLSHACAQCDAVMGPLPAGDWAFTVLAAPNVKTQAVKALGLIPAAIRLSIRFEARPRAPDERRSALTPVSPVRLYTRLLN